MPDNCHVHVFLPSENRWALQPQPIIEDAADQYLHEMGRKRELHGLNEEELHELHEYFLEVRIRRVLERVFPSQRACCTISLREDSRTIYSDTEVRSRPASSRIYSVIESPSGKGLAYDIDVLNGTSTEVEETVCFFMAIVVLVAGISTILYK